MKISSKQNEKAAIKDFDTMVKSLIEEHGNIFFAEIGDNIFIYKALGRKKYKDIVLNPELVDIEREDVICQECVLYPEDFDVDEVEAGIPSELYAQILTNSFLTGTDQMLSLIEACRDEVQQLDIQMSCIISEAFPAYDIDEIESWDMIKFCRMFGRAEWKLKNLRNMEFENDVVTFLKEQLSDLGELVEEESNNEIETSKTQHQISKDNGSKVKVGNREMTQEEYRQYLEFQKAHPEINFGADTMYTGFDTMGYNDLPVALRPRR